MTKFTVMPAVLSYTRRPVRIFVPEAATIARIVIAGGAGGATGSEPGGDAEVVIGTLDVRAGQSLQVFVGGEGGCVLAHDDAHLVAAAGWRAPGYEGESCVLHGDCWTGRGGGATAVLRDGIMIAIARGGNGAGDCSGRGVARGGSERGSWSGGMWDVAMEPASTSGDGTAIVLFDGPPSGLAQYA